MIQTEIAQRFWVDHTAIGQVLRGTIRRDTGAA